MSKSSMAYDELEGKVLTAIGNAGGEENIGAGDYARNSFYGATYGQGGGCDLPPDDISENDEITAFEQTNIISGDNEDAPPLQNDGGLILGKFKTVNDLIDAYRNSEKFISKTRQELKAVKEQFSKMSAANISPNAQTSQVNADNMVQSANDSALPHASQYTEDNKLQIDQRNIDKEAVMSLVKLIANGQMPSEKQNETTQMPSPVDIDKLMADEGFVEKYILSNPKVTGIVAKDMLRRHKENEPPNVINRSGGAQLSMPQNRPKTFEEAGNAFKKMLEKINNN